MVRLVTLASVWFGLVWFGLEEGGGERNNFGRCTGGGMVRVGIDGWAYAVDRMGWDG